MPGDQTKPAGNGGGGGGNGGAAAAAPTRCDQGGPEIIVGVIPVAQGDKVNLRIVLCKAAFRLTVDLDGKRLVDQDPFPGDEANVLLPPLAPGHHQLLWGYIAAGPDWQTLSEVSVNGVVRFRLRKGSASDLPFNFSGVGLAVV